MNGKIVDNHLSTNVNEIINEKTDFEVFEIVKNHRFVENNERSCRIEVVGEEKADRINRTEMRDLEM